MPRLEAAMTETDPTALLPLTSLTYHILLALADANRHGYGIIKEVEDRTDGQMELETGTLYAAIKRMRDERLIEVVPQSKRPAGEDSRRRTYRLTPFGKKVLKAESRRLAHLLGIAAEKKVLPIAPT
jgi:DNA-binding PadR family transcriptional regulator